MEKINNEMKESNTIDINWVLDSQITERDKDPKEVSYIINAINSEVEKRKQMLTEIESNIEQKKNLGEDFSHLLPDFILPNFSLRKPSYLKSYFSPSQRWIGQVIKLYETGFTAKLEDINQHDTYEIGEFEKKEVSNEDIELLSLGAIFYWSIGYAVINGQVIKQSLIRFQRVSEWTISDFDDSADRANKLHSKLKWE